MIEITKVENGFILSRDDVPEHAFVSKTLGEVISQLLSVYYNKDGSYEEYREYKSITFERKDGIWREV